METNTQSQTLQHYLVTATIVRDEGRYLREFVMFHREVGVDHMLIYDDGSVDNTAEVVEPFEREGFVTFIAWPRFIHQRNNQFLAYQHAIASQRGKAFWLAMIDADEFLFAPASGDLKSELKQRETHTCIGVYSHTFGTSGLAELDPHALMTRQLTHAALGDYSKNCTQRSIVQPSAVAGVRSANTCVMHETQIIGWDEDGRPILQTGEAGHGRKFLRINHYFSRAKGDFDRKVSRSYFGNGKWSHKMQAKVGELIDLDARAVVDDDIRPWVERLERQQSRLKSPSRLR
jgi:Glycosyltransferase family 92